MPNGTPIKLKCPKCHLGEWGRPEAVKGVHPTGEVEQRITKSKHCGHGGGGAGFRGHRGQVKCEDCGHIWYSTHPQSGRVRA